MQTPKQHLQEWAGPTTKLTQEKSVNTHGETSIERAKRLYVEDKISLEVLEDRLERAFKRKEGLIYT